MKLQRLQLASLIARDTKLGPLDEQVVIELPPKVTSEDLIQMPFLFADGKAHNIPSLNRGVNITVVEIQVHP
jgi:hypothetical protein